jgi:hypothetical protein
MGRVIGWLLVLIILAAIGYYVGRQTCPAPPPAPGARTVYVGITGDRAPYSIIPDPVVTRRGDVIAWVHPTADEIVIDLRGDRLGVPTADSVVSALQGETARTTVRSDAALGQYKYTVIVQIGAQRDTIDPHIIVEEEEGGL